MDTVEVPCSNHQETTAIYGVPSLHCVSQYGQENYYMRYSLNGGI